MRKAITTITVALALAACGAAALAVDPPPDNSKSEIRNPQSPIRVREIYVPFDDLSVLLENQPQRVLLPKAQYEELLAKAKRTAQDHAPRSGVLVSAEYAATASEERVEIVGTLVVSILEDGLHAVALDLGGVGLRAATLDGRGAAIGRADDGRLTLFVEGKGEHKLVLDLVAPLQTTAARQFLNFRLPTPAAARLSLTIPGDVEVKSGASVVSRTFDEAAARTRIELLAQPGDVSLVMSLNSRLKRKDRIVVARSVLVDEVTAAYERLHVTVSMSILHRAVDQFRFAVPAGFEVTDVRTANLARWAIATEGDRRILEVQLREETTDPVVLNLSAVRMAPKLDAWTLPKLEPLDVAGQVSVVCLAIEDRLKVEGIVADGLVPIDTAVLAQALPATVLEAEPGAARLRPVVAYYAPQGTYSLAARLVKPPAGLRSITNLLATLTDGSIEIRGGFALVPEEEKVFAVDFSVPAGWEVTAVTDGSGRALAMERYGAAEAAGRIHVRLPAGAPAGAETRIEFAARYVPAGWFADWATKSVDFPVFAVAGAARDEGAIAVEARDDMTVRPESLDGLTPLDDNEKARYGLSRSGSVLAYRYDAQPYKARLAVGRKEPRITAQVHSFFRIERDALVAHYELAFDVAGARTRRLSLVLPKDTPTALSIRGLGGLAIKEYTSEMIGEKDKEQRRWTALLADGRSGTLRIAVDFQQRLAGADLKNLLLPVILADGVAYQSGLVAVEGSAELAVQIKDPAPRKVDIGELVAAEYQPGRRLLGVYGYLGSPPPVAVAVTREAAYALPPAVVQRGQLLTVVSADGVAQTWATFLLKTKALVLEVRLPEHSALWAAELDGQPLKPQREGDRLLVNLPAGGEGAMRALRVVYDTPVGSLGFWRGVDVPAPRLFLHQAAGAEGAPTATVAATSTSATAAPTSAKAAAAATAAVEVPLVDLEWQVCLPDGYKVVQFGGTVDTRQVQSPPLALSMIGDVLWSASGGVDTRHSVLAFFSGAGVRTMKESAGYRGTYAPADKAAADVKSTAEPQDYNKVDADVKSADGRETVSVVKAPRSVFNMEWRSDRAGEAGHDIGGAAGLGDNDGIASEGFIQADRPVAATGAPVAPGRAGGGGRGKGAAGPVAAKPAQPEAVMLGDLNTLSGGTTINGGTINSSAAPGFSGAITSATGTSGVPLTKIGAGTLNLATEFAARPKSEVAVTGNLVLGVKGTRAWLTGNRLSVEGQSSLAIEPNLPPGPGERITFQSLGSEPRLRLTVADAGRVSALAWALALAVIVVGLALTTRPAGRKAAYIVGVCLVATLIPVITGRIELASAVNGSFLAACLLVPYYIVAAIVRWAVRKFRSWTAVSPAAPASPAGPAAMLLLIAVAAGALAVATLGAGAATAAGAGDPPAVPGASMITMPAGSSASVGPYVVELVPPSPPVRVPDDAIILPYDPDSKAGIRSADRVLVPYARYEELWNLAHPEKPLAAKKPPAAYALAGASLAASLRGDEFLLMEGTIDIDVYTDEYVSVPLPLEGGVLAKADLDGKPARLSVVQADPASPVAANAPAAKQAAAAVALPRSMVVLYVSGKGRHRLDLAVRMRLEKRGGWRVAEGRLPAAPATALAIGVPDAGTEIRLGAVPDRRSYETKAAGESIRTALPPDGAISIQWRPKVSEGQIDQTLTADSRAVLDVQEDSVHVAWALNLEFRRGERDFFTIEVPQGYLVEKVEGANVRGWEMRDASAGGAGNPPAVPVASGGQELTVTLLKRAKGAESFTVSLWRPTEKGGAGEFVAPIVGVAGALRQSGELVIRRSPLLDLRTVATTGVTAIDMPTASSNPLLAKSAPAIESPLGIRPYQAYRFAAAPFTIRLAAAPVAPKVAATVQTVLKVGQRERTLESRIMLTVEDRPLYRARIVVPADLKLDAVQAPGQVEWALTDAGSVAPGAKILTVYLAAGVRGQCPILIQGKLGAQPRPVVTGQDQRNQATAPVLAEAASGTPAQSGQAVPPDAAVEAALPRIEVLDVDRQEGDIAVQVEPAWEARAEALVNIERVLLDRFTWLAAGQKSLAALALHYTRPDYSGTVKLSRREAQVTCITVTNARVTDRAIEEAVLIDWTITGAGIRRVEFILPAWMKEARIRVPLLRQKTILPLGDDLAPVAEGKPAAFVRVTLDLQDEVMGQLRVLVENDRLLTDAAHAAPIPTVLTGRTDRRYAAVESAGRDEVMITQKTGLEPLTPQQKEWSAVSGLFRGGVTQAFIVAASAAKPVLEFRTQPRKAVETAEARIGLAETTLVMDATGAYRAQQIYRIDNRTEQFLEIQLPAGAALWTAVVAGEPVKPVVLAGAAAGRVKIPLVKTAAGDLDYAVVLKYAGKLPPLGSLRMTIRFPMIKAVNIQPEASQLQLYVPEGYSWFDFRPEDYGWYDFRGQMVRASDADLKAGQLAYENKKSEKLIYTLSSGNEFEKTRAATNLKIVEANQRMIENSLQSANRDGLNKIAQDEITNAGALRDRGAKALQEQQASAAVTQFDNNDSMRKNFAEQRNVRAGQGLQNTIGYNWNAEVQPQAAPQGAVATFNGGWFDANGLQNPQAKAPDQSMPMDQGRMNFNATDQQTLTAQKTSGGKLQITLEPAQRQPQAAGELMKKLADEAKDKEEAARQAVQAEDNRVAGQSKSQLYQQRYAQAGQQEQQQASDSYGVAVNGRERSAPQDDAAQRVLAVNAANMPPEKLAELIKSKYAARGIQLTDAEARKLTESERGKVLSISAGGDWATAHNWDAAAGPGGVAGVGGAGGAAAAPAGPTGFASLDFEIPTRGQPYRFTTVRGNLGIAAAAASEPMIESLIRIGGVVLFIVVVLVARRLLRGRSLGIRMQAAISTALILLGIIGMFVGVFWAAGLVAALVGIVMKVYLFIARRRAVPAAG